ncbi:TIGR03086 family metal-binding protein [Galbitalea soli]|uniref:TIGR03086 family protein n=1 Tax=Galbitalea soli TaxID=1268042 RepID=A0A7C9TP44_9MICO|nr:TIGR03086 family metal-binding protein [Galbitalea soli]NEM90537.1 TIGR03086 family protein [Galbitalea soli]NYJ31250.1 uncharacterized protein (TIGR03086 family) [Galbitalea soli]
MTSDWLALQVLAHQEFATRIAAVSDWHAPTPDAEWDVADLVRHVTEEQQWVPHLLRGLSIDEAQKLIEPLGSDLAAEWAKYSAAAAEAWSSTPRGSSVQLSSDTVTMEDYLKEQVADVTIHSWDLARAVGADETLDPALVEATWTIFEPQRATLAASGLYASPVELGDDVPLQDRLLALTGRDPR